MQCAKVLVQLHDNPRLKDRDPTLVSLWVSSVSEVQPRALERPMVHQQRRWCAKRTRSMAFQSEEHLVQPLQRRSWMLGVLSLGGPSGHTLGSSVEQGLWIPRTCAWQLWWPISSGHGHLSSAGPKTETACVVRLRRRMYSKRETFQKTT